MSQYGRPSSTLLECARCRYTCQAVIPGRWPDQTFPQTRATIQQPTATGERNIDLPISDARFATEEEAESFVVSRAKEWIERNAPPDTST